LRIDALSQGEETTVTIEAFWIEVETIMAKYDLLKHPFYQAWTNGELTLGELKDYAANYYTHVAAFPEYLSTLAKRLPDGQTREIVLQNREEELGSNSRDGRTHADLWMDFAEGVGAASTSLPLVEPYPEIDHLVAHFSRTAQNSTLVEALCSFYAYESQIPAIAAEKEQGLSRYGVDEKTSYYFTLHKTYDVHHARVWKEEISRQLLCHPEQKKKALEAVENTANALWKALDGVERVRQENKGGAFCGACC
jgi:pyrroloquinoline-quinone synthase